MSTVDQPIPLPTAEAKPRAKKLVPHRRPPFRDVWWRHLVAWIAIAVSLFPIAYIVRTAQRRLRPDAPPRADIWPTARFLNRALLGLLDVESRVALASQIPYGLSIFAVARKPVK